MRDVVGGRAGGYERALSGARDAALEGLVEAAKELGANGMTAILVTHDTQEASAMAQHTWGMQGGRLVAMW